jgi:hypothetical protein
MSGFPDMTSSSLKDDALSLPRRRAGRQAHLSAKRTFPGRVEFDRKERSAGAAREA